MSTTARNTAAQAPAAPAAKKTAKKTAAKPSPRSAPGPGAKVPASRGRATAKAPAELSKAELSKAELAASELAKPEPAASESLASVPTGILPVRPGEDAWTAPEVAEVEADLRADVDRLRADVVAADTALADLLRDASDGAGDDQADAGSKNFEREHEMSIANNAREMLGQSERALSRIAAGTYGACESCGESVGKARLQVFPRATLCMACKQRQERR